MTLITLRNAHLAFGDRPLLDGAELTVHAGEQIGFIGRNGTGKSTVLKLIAGVSHLDEGELQRRTNLRCALLEQEPLLPPAPTVRESLIERARSMASASSCTAEELNETDRDGWRLRARLSEYLQRFGLTGNENPNGCSGGERKRAALALSFACEPEVLLLDEPTNHLDIDGIAQLEACIRDVPVSIIVTHDRAFLDAVATRIIELDRGAIRSYPGNFAAYEARKEQETAAEDVARRRFEKFWRQEEAWIRKGVEARRTRNEGRVHRLEQLRQERAAQRERIGHIKLALDAGERSGRLVAELTGIYHSFDGRPLVADFSTIILRGDRVGFIGANGAGKSTLLRIILGALPPQRGSVRLGTNLQIAYFDQMREQLDPNWTVTDAINPGSEWITIGEERKHVITYLGDFLFSAQRAQSPVKMLSGGERNRLLLARLFARPANLLVLDEPTNDLDIDSLELLEQRLQEYPGTLLLVSHDRRFLDNIVTQTISAEGHGQWRVQVGGYSDWLRQRTPVAAPAVHPCATADAPPAPKPGAGSRNGRLGYMEKRELTALPGQIEALEHEQAEIGAHMSRRDYHLQGPDHARAARDRLQEISDELQRLYARWEALEARASGNS
jgi:ATP-binding cassette subfamily F protein uup